MDLPASTLLEAILEGAGSPLLALSPGGKVIEANRVAILWMETQPASRSSIEQAIQDGKREFEIAPYAFSVRPARDGKLFIVEGRDTSTIDAERRRAQIAYELANMGVWTWDLKKNLVHNDSERGVFGHLQMVDATREEAMNRIHPDDRAYLLAEADAAVASRSGFRVEVRGIVPVTGELKWVAVSGTVRCDEGGEPVRVEGVSLDITERKETELRLRESEARFRVIFANAGIGIALISPEGVPIETNAALEQLLGYTAAELRKMHFKEFTHPDDVDRDVLLYQEVMAGKRQRYEIEKRFIRKNGEVIWGKLVASLVRNVDGTPVFGIGMVEDVTQQKLVEEEVLSLGDKLITTQERERSRIARELHDGLGQQIAALSISVASLKRQIPEQDAEPRMQMLRLQQRIAAIAEGIRRISHELHPAVLELAGIAAALRSHCKQFSTDNGVSVALEVEGGFDHLTAEAALCLYRVAQEALQNIAKHSGAKEARVQLELAGEGVLLTVSDGGRGFDADIPAVRAGLGLVSMKERARLLHGTLKITSAPGQGTTLRVPFRSPWGNPRETGGAGLDTPAPIHGGADRPRSRPVPQLVRRSTPRAEAGIARGRFRTGRRRQRTSAASASTRRADPGSAGAGRGQDRRDADRRR